jgi:S-adenosylmethionine hydrolase
MIAILSDFQDSEYLGVMKGVILKHNPSATIVDLYNKVNPQDIREAAWILLLNYRHFPKNTVFLCVVDPGVGSERQCLAVKTSHYHFVGPDNGLLYLAVMDDGPVTTVALSDGKASRTFHGRDVFAPASAMLDKGSAIGGLGNTTVLKEKLEFYLKGRVGEVVHVDSFGNIITNIPPSGRQEYALTVGGEKKRLAFHESYADAPTKGLFLIKGSAGTLELSVKNGSAARKLRLKSGTRVEIS